MSMTIVLTMWSSSFDQEPFCRPGWRVCVCVWRARISNCHTNLITTRSETHPEHLVPPMQTLHVRARFPQQACNLNVENGLCLCWRKCTNMRNEPSSSSWRRSSPRCPSGGRPLPASTSRQPRLCAVPVGAPTALGWRYYWIGHLAWLRFHQNCSNACCPTEDIQFISTS